MGVHNVAARVLLLPVLVGLAELGRASTFSSCASSAGASYTGYTSAVAWGSNAAGQLGSSRSSLLVSPFPVPFAKNMKISKISGMFMHTAVLDTDSNTAWLAGDAAYGQLGGGPLVSTSQSQFIPFPFLTDTSAGGVPIAFPNRRVLDVSCGLQHTCCVVESKTTTGSGDVFCTGSNAQSQLGSSGFGQSWYLVQVTNATDPIFSAESFVGVYAGGAHTVALGVSGKLWSWGDNSFGQLGDGSVFSNPSSTPRVVQLPQAALKACCGFNYCLALISANKTLYGWGSNAQQQLGRNDAAFFAVPIPIMGNVDQFSCGQAHAVAVVAGTAYSWGEGTNGATGQARTISAFAFDDWFSSPPAPVPSLTNVVVQSISAGAKHTIVLDTCGRVFTMGSDTFGQQGQGYLMGAATTFQSATPILNAAVQNLGLTSLSVWAAGLSSFVVSQLQTST